MSLLAGRSNETIFSALLDAFAISLAFAFNDWKTTTFAKRPRSIDSSRREQRSASKSLNAVPRWQIFKCWFENRPCSYLMIYEFMMIHDDLCWFMILFDYLWWFMIVYDYLWWFMMIHDDLCRLMILFDSFWLFMMIYDWLIVYDYLWLSMMIYDDLWWFMIIYDYLWWFMMIYDDLWWFMMIYDDLWRFMMIYMILLVCQKRFWFNIPPPSLASAVVARSGWLQDRNWAHISAASSLWIKVES